MRSVISCLSRLGQDVACARRMAAGAGITIDCSDPIAKDMCCARVLSETQQIRCYCASPSDVSPSVSGNGDAVSNGSGASWAQGSSLPMSKPAGEGFGFRKRFKDMRTVELEKLLQRSREAGLVQPPARRRKLHPPAPAFHCGQFASQWELAKSRVEGPYRPNVKTDVFAVIEAGHTQFKVVPDDKIFVHRLNGADVDDIITFNRVLLAGTPNDTLIGRPFLPGMTVTAAVEEHIRDSTVYIYKRRRAKGYRRFRGFRAELTGLRILEIKGADRHGVEVPVWQDGVSTPLLAETPSSLARRQAKRARVERHWQDHIDKLQEEPGSSSGYGRANALDQDVQVMPLTSGDSASPQQQDLNTQPGENRPNAMA